MTHRLAIIAVPTILATVWAAEAQGQLVILDDLLALTQAAAGGGEERRESTASFGQIPGAGSERISELRPQHAEYHELGLRGRLDPGRHAPRGPRALRVGGVEEDDEPVETIISRLARLRQEGPPGVGRVAPFGVLDLPALPDEGPPEGWTLDLAIRRLLEENLELQTDIMELFMADADIHAASRFNNPLLFWATDGVPYQVDRQREQEIAHDFTVVYPFDVTNTRRNRTKLAERARSVIGAQYQDAARREVHALYMTFVDVLAARESIRYAASGIVSVDRLIQQVQQQVQTGEKPASDLEELLAMRELTMLAIRQGQRDYTGPSGTSPNS